MSVTVYNKNKVTPANYKVATRALSTDDRVQQVQIDIGTGTSASPVTASNPMPTTVSGTVATTVSDPTLTASSPTFATIGTSSGTAIASNANRKGLTLVNDSANTIYLAFGAPAVLGRGIRLNANGGSFNMSRYNFFTGQINAIASGAGSNLTVQEFT